MTGGIRTSIGRMVATAGICLGCALAVVLHVAAQVRGPDFSASYKVGPHTARVGEVITYTVIVVNNGGAATDVALYELWPAGLAPIPDSCLYDVGPAPQPGSLQLPCRAEASAAVGLLWQMDVAAGARITTTFAATVTAGTLLWPLRNCARWVWNNLAGDLCVVTTVNPITHIYLPVVLRGWIAWYEYDIYEPNDTPLQAYGPLVQGQWYERGYIWDASDPEDYYHFTPPRGVTVTVELTHIPVGCDYDLYVLYYDSATCPAQYNYYCEAARSAQDGHVDERATFLAEERRYYVRIHPFSGFSSQQPYRLRVDW